MDFNQIFKSIEGPTKTLAMKVLKGYTTQALADLTDFAQQSRADLARWTQQLQQKKLSPEEYKSLVQGELDVAAMRALKQAGLAQVQIDTFTSGFLDILVGAAKAAIPL
jgi:hypothetical protein